MLRSANGCVRHARSRALRSERPRQDRGAGRKNGVVYSSQVIRVATLASRGASGISRVPKALRKSLIGFILVAQYFAATSPGSGPDVERSHAFRDTLRAGPLRSRTVGNRATRSGPY